MGRVYFVHHQVAGQISYWTCVLFHVRAPCESLSVLMLLKMKLRLNVLETVCEGNIKVSENVLIVTNAGII